MTKQQKTALYISLGVVAIGTGIGTYMIIKKRKEINDLEKEYQQLATDNLIKLNKFGDQIGVYFKGMKKPAFVDFEIRSNTSYMSFFFPYDNHQYKIVFDNGDEYTQNAKIVRISDGKIIKKFIFKK